MVTNVEQLAYIWGLTIIITQYIVDARMMG